MPVYLVMGHGRQLSHHQAVLGSFLRDCCQEGAQIRHAQAHLHKPLQPPWACCYSLQKTTYQGIGIKLRASGMRQCTRSDAVSTPSSDTMTGCEDLLVHQLLAQALPDAVRIPLRACSYDSRCLACGKEIMHEGMRHLHGPDGQAVGSEACPLEKHLHVAAVLHRNSTFTLSSQVKPCKPC